ncbi:hypothetical protein D9613_010945 [Agrocybe pediades]|uniref:Protein kinase domain-containing protein n=1 Tax=Agrocybe pediades TaxID=84607 RepID=A0A8H4QLU7_9AGAR|nr:hypothetical protein D9613_010945 [Agrocybe pediades]
MRSTLATRLIHNLTHRIRFPAGPPPNSFRLEKLNPKPYTFEELPDRPVFIAREDLQVGKGRWSQVYRGSLQSVSTKYDGTSFSDSKETQDVVLKVFKQSLFPGQIYFFNRHKRCREKGISPWWNQSTEEHMCWSEAFSYLTLASLQGESIPKFIDAYMVKSPDSDEESMAIAMSHVAGRSIFQVCQELGADNDPDPGLWYPIAMEMLRTAHLMRQKGIIARDLRDVNILVDENHSKESPSKYSLKIIDFATAEPSKYVLGDDGKAVFDEILDVVMMEVLIAKICGNEQEHPVGWDLDGPTRRRSEFLKWLKKNYGDEQFVKDYWFSLEKCVYDDYCYEPSRGPDYRNYFPGHL